MMVIRYTWHNGIEWGIVWKGIFFITRLAKMIYA